MESYLCQRCLKKDKVKRELELGLCGGGMAHFMYGGPIMNEDKTTVWYNCPRCASIEKLPLRNLKHKIFMRCYGLLPYGTRTFMYGKWKPFAWMLR